MRFSRTRVIFFFAFVFICRTGFAQGYFEPGYFLDNEGIRHEGLIKNSDWYNNPRSFFFKTEDSSTAQELNLEKVSEFGFIGGERFVRARVQMDRSSDKVGSISTKRNPEYMMETVFLRLLVAGKATLYSYVESDLNRFFYTFREEEIMPLVYKKYKVDNVVAENLSFIPQLNRDVPVQGQTEAGMSKLRYNQKDLVGYFSEYNLESGNEAYISRREGGKPVFHMFLRGGYAFSSFSVKENIIGDRTFSFDNPQGFYSGVQFEYVLPYRHRSWALLIEVSYYKIGSRSTGRNLEFNSIDFPIGGRYYFLQKTWGKVYVNAAFTLSVGPEFSIEFDSKKLEWDRRNSYLQFGVGANLGRVQFEFRKDAPRNLAYAFQSHSATLNNNVIVLGCRIF